MKTPKVLTDLFKQADEVKLTLDSPAPKGEQEAGDEIIGVLPNNLMRLYVAIAQHKDNALYGIYLAIFWEAVKEAFPQSAGKLADRRCSINLRTNWQVVISAKQETITVEVLGF